MFLAGRSEFCQGNVDQWIMRQDFCLKSWSLFTMCLNSFYRVIPWLSKINPHPVSGGKNRNPSPLNTTHWANRQFECGVKSLQILQSKCSVFSLIVCPSLDIQEEMHQEDGRRHVSLIACRNNVCPGILPGICLNKQASYIEKHTENFT